MIVLDTNVFISFLEGDKAASSLINRNAGEIAFSAVTEGELLSSDRCNDLREREKVMHLLSLFHKIPVDNPLIQVAAMVRRANRIKLPDAIIAASAMVNDAKLATRNIGDFKKIAGLELEVP